MPRLSSPHAGSLQFWPRKRAEKIVSSVNWDPIKGKDNVNSILGFMTYKVGMGTAVVKDNTEHSMTKGKKIAMPVTILEAPNMKVFSVRFYLHNKVEKDIIVSTDKELKRVVRLPKEVKPFDGEVPAKYDDIRVVAYSLPNQINLKKAPDIVELAVNAKNKLEYVKSLIGKEISLTDFLQYSLVDVRGLTIGKGLVGPVKRFGINLKQHKTEKGVRRPGSLGPWHPARVTFVTPISGQLGMFTRVHYNLNVIASGNAKEKNINKGTGFKAYGNVTGNYLVVKGSVQGPAKRQILVTPSYRPTKHTFKRKLEFQELVV
jgi:large subunit ribosomal protein L3